MKLLFRCVCAGLVLAGPVCAGDVVSNAMSGLCYPTLAAGVEASTDGDTLVMIADHVLPSTLVISNRVVSIVSDGTKRTISASTNCEYDMVFVTDLAAVLTLGASDGSGDDAEPTLVLSGGMQAGINHLYDMIIVDRAELNLHAGVVLADLASRDVGAIYNVGGLVHMHGGRIENNTAPFGAGIFNEEGDFFFYGGSITGNWAQVGGGIYNRAAMFFNEYIVGYLGQVQMTGGTVGNNRADEAGGGVFNMGRFVFSGGNIASNTAPEGGGILHFNGTDFGLNMSGSAWVASNTADKGSGIYYNNDEFTWLTLGGGARVEPPNDIFYAAGSSAIWLSEPLTGHGISAQITPFAYNTNAYVLGALTDDDLWLVTNYYGKFSVTPDPADQVP